MMRILPFLFLAAVLTMPLSAYAAETTPAAPATSKEEIQKTLEAAPKQPEKPTINPYEDLPDEYIAEAQKYYADCNKDTNMNRYYDCKCMATKYLDTRINAGPKATPSSIGLKISTMCLDATGAAGYEYDQCLNERPPSGLQVPFEDYCACFANTYAKLFEYSNAGASSRVFQAIHTQAVIACSDQDLARKMFPESPAISYANEMLNQK